MKSFYTNVQTVKDNILLRAVVDGKRVISKIPYKPKMYVPSQKPGATWKTLKGEPLEEMEFGSIQDCKEFLDKYSGVDNFTVYGNNRMDYAFIADAFPGDVPWDIDKIVSAYIDIEVSSANGFPDPDKATEEVTAITFYIAGKYHVFGTKSFKTDDLEIIYIQCDNEKDMLLAFIDLWAGLMPDVVTGWNLKMFDIPYLINRILIVLGDDGNNQIKRLSPWAWIKPREVTVFKKVQNYYDIFGVTILDYFDLYKKYAPHPNQETYKLGYIAHVELDEAKLDYSEYSSLHKLYLENYQKYIEYNIHDVRLVLKLEKKLKLLELAFTLAYQSKTNFDDVFSQVRMWDAIIYNDLKSKKIAIPPKKDVVKKQQYEGAYVKEPKPGRYNWLASFDLTSLYPHLIMMYNLSPETLVDQTDYDDELQEFYEVNHYNISVDGLLDQIVDTSLMKEKQITITPNKQFFKINQQGFLSGLMEKMYNGRAIYKNKMLAAMKDLEKATDPIEIARIKNDISKYKNFQMAMKVCLNSAYGAIGNQYFRFFDVRIAEAVTMSGQLSARWIVKKLNQFLNKMAKTEKRDYIVASDTDSVYIDMSAIVEKAFSNQSDTKKIIEFMDKICSNLIQPFIDKSFQELVDYVNAYDQKMIMKREALVDTAIWTGKKHYIMRVHNSEGVQYTKPVVKIVGLEAIKSSTPEICRKKMKEVFELILDKNKDAFREFVTEFREEFNKLSIQDIATPTSMNGLEKYGDDTKIFGFKTPPHTKGSLIFNHHLKRLGLEHKYETIKDGEKVRYVYLKTPNPFQEEVVSFLSVIPPEFGLEKYINIDAMFEKNFKDPVQAVLKAIGWTYDPINSLEDLFG